MFDFFKNLFRGKGQADRETLPPPSPPSDPDATVPLTEMSVKAIPDAARLLLKPVSGSRLAVGMAQDVGRVRSHNEDVLLAFHGELAGLEAMPNFGLFVVADGMGGHSLGERASSVATRAIARSVLDQVLPSLLADPQTDIERPSLTEVMERAMSRANDAVVENVPEGGTTLTSALILGDQLILSHVGDSRAYLFADGHAEQLTRDHSLVQRLVEMGQITEDEAAVHQQRSVLYRAVGQGEGLEVDVMLRRLSPGTVLLICSDGLWSLLPTHLIQQIIRQSSTVQTASEALVKAANDAGGPDNITAILIQLPG
ncbi:MAG: PP2C family protein-serine/threonine phosphatase [Anaerolineales bacterium]